MRQVGRAELLRLRFDTGNKVELKLVILESFGQQIKETAHQNEEDLLERPGKLAAEPFDGVVELPTDFPIQTWSHKVGKVDDVRMEIEVRLHAAADAMVRAHGECQEDPEVDILELHVGYVVNINDGRSSEFDFPEQLRSAGLHHDARRLEVAQTHCLGPKWKTEIDLALEIEGDRIGYAGFDFEIWRRAEMGQRRGVESVLVVLLQTIQDVERIERVEHIVRINRQINDVRLRGVIIIRGDHHISPARAEDGVQAVLQQIGG